MIQFCKNCLPKANTSVIFIIILHLVAHLDCQFYYYVKCQFQYHCSWGWPCSVQNTAVVHQTCDRHQMAIGLWGQSGCQCLSGYHHVKVNNDHVCCSTLTHDVCTIDEWASGQQCQWSRKCDNNHECKRINGEDVCCRKNWYRRSQNSWWSTYIVCSYDFVWETINGFAQCWEKRQVEQVEYCPASVAAKCPDDICNPGYTCRLSNCDVPVCCKDKPIHRMCTPGEKGVDCSTSCDPGYKCKKFNSTSEDVCCYEKVDLICNSRQQCTANFQCPYGFNCTYARGAYYCCKQTRNDLPICPTTGLKAEETCSATKPCSDCTRECMQVEGQNVCCLRGEQHFNNSIGHGLCMDGMCPDGYCIDNQCYPEPVGQNYNEGQCPDRTKSNIFCPNKCCPDNMECVNGLCCRMDTYF